MIPQGTARRDGSLQANWADQSSWRRDKVEVCRSLVDTLDPNRPPAQTTPKEYEWQLRALRERLYVYEQLVRSRAQAKDFSDFRLQKAETALELSLRYFQDVLSRTDADD
jgi:hypothetical protein